MANTTVHDNDLNKKGADLPVIDLAIGQPLFLRKGGLLMYAAIESIDIQRVASGGLIPGTLAGDATDTTVRLRLLAIPTDLRTAKTIGDQRVQGYVPTGKRLRRKLT